MGKDVTVVDAFHGQAKACRKFGSPLTAAILDTLADTLDEQTRVGRAILGWQGHPLDDALPLRLAGGLHALARSGRDQALTRLYRGEGVAATILPRVIADFDDELLPWLESPPQTNEVQRSAALMAGLAVVAERFAMPIELLELGASAGLNLNLDRFHHVLGETHLGDTDSPLLLQPEWRGASPPSAPPVVATRAAVDRSPIDVSVAEVAEHLIAYVWPDQVERIARIEAAIGIARAHPPQVERGDAGEWIEQRLDAPQAGGVARVVMHSVFWQYLSCETQARIETAIRNAGSRATSDRPLARLSFEPGPNLWTMALTLRLWPEGEERELALCHPHGAQVEWKG